MDPERITTAVVVEPDGRIRHVPTEVITADGKYYAKVNSLTDSTYTVIWNPISFADVEHHWAMQTVNNMGSRLVVYGTGDENTVRIAILPGQSSQPFLYVGWD